MHHNSFLFFTPGPDGGELGEYPPVPPPWIHHWFAICLFVCFNIYLGTVKTNVSLMKLESTPNCYHTLMPDLIFIDNQSLCGCLDGRMCSPSLRRITWQLQHLQRTEGGCTSHLDILGTLGYLLNSSLHHWP